MPAFVVPQGELDGGCDSVRQGSSFRVLRMSCSINQAKHIQRSQFLLELLSCTVRPSRETPKSAQLGGSQPGTHLAIPGHIFGCHDTGGHCWCPRMGRGRACGWTSHHSQDSSSRQRITWSKMSLVARLRNPHSNPCPKYPRKKPAGNIPQLVDLTRATVWYSKTKQPSY